MSTKNEFNNSRSPKVEKDYPDLDKLSEWVKQKFNRQPTKVNVFKMMGYLQTFNLQPDPQEDGNWLKW